MFAVFVWYILLLFKQNAYDFRNHEFQDRLQEEEAKNGSGRVTDT